MAPPALPDELWQMVFAHLVIRPGPASEPQTNRSNLDTLLSCMRVSRTLNRVAEAVLYRVIDARVHSLYNLLRLTIRLACEPRLGLMVKYVGMMDDLQPELAAGIVSDESMQNITKVAMHRCGTESLSIPEPFGKSRTALDYVGYDGDWPSSYAIMSLLILFSPNLESIDVDTGVCARVMPTLSQCRPARLRNICARLETDPDPEAEGCAAGVTLPELESYLEFPALDSLRVDSMPGSFRDFTFCWTGFKPSCHSNLKHLYLRDTFIGEPHITMILTACTQLSTLYMTFAAGRSDGYRPAMYDTVCAIQTYGKQLQELVIVAYGISGESRRSWRQIEPFEGFEKLRFVALPVELLIPQFTLHDLVNEPFLQPGGDVILEALKSEDDRQTTTPVDYHYEVSLVPGEISRLNRRLHRNTYRVRTDGTMRTLATLFPTGLESISILYEDEPEAFYVYRDDYQIETLMRSKELPMLHTVKIRREMDYKWPSCSPGWAGTDRSYVEPFDNGRVANWQEYRQFEFPDEYATMAPNIGA